MLATSREPLRVGGEVVFRVPSLAIPDPEQLRAPGDLLRYEAVRLFVERAVAADPGFALDDENAADVARICFRLDGLPLALELAAGRIGALSPAALAERLDDRFRLLRSGSRAAPTRQQTLAATLQWSHDLLEPDERMLLRRLSVFAGGFELGAVEAVCAGAGLDLAESADVLARLVEKSLVAVDEGGRERRYRLLETVRLYARERLDDAGETRRDRRTARGLGARAGGARARLAAARPRGGEPARRARHAARARAARRAAASASRSGRSGCAGSSWTRRTAASPPRSRPRRSAPSSAPRRCSPRRPIDFRAGTLPRGIARAEESHADRLGARRPARPVAGHAVPRRVRGREGRGRGRGALARTRSRARAEREASRAPEAICVYSLGVTRWIRGDIRGRGGAPRAEPGALPLARRLAGAHPVAASTSPRCGPAASSAGPGLRIVFEDTLQPFLEVSCDEAIGYVLANIASVARMQGDLDRAQALLDEAAERFEQMDDPRGRAAVLVRRAYLELANGSIPEARACLERALVLRRRLNDRRGLGLVLAGLGLIDTTAGDHESAERHLAEARQIFRRAGDRWGLASTLWRTADLAFERGRLDDAESALREALSVIGVTQRERWIAYTLAGLAEVATLQGDAGRAATLFADARDRYASTGDDAGHRVRRRAASRAC